MHDSDQQRAEDEFQAPSERPAREPEDEWTSADMMTAYSISAVSGAVMGGILAWGLDAPIGGQVAGAGVGAVLMAIIRMLWQASPLGALQRRSTRESCDAFRWATEPPRRQGGLGEAVKGALKREPAKLSYWAWREAIFLGFLGALVGTFAGGLWWIVGLALGALLGAACGWIFEAGLTALFIALVRLLGPQVGGACIGALVGGGFGFLLWDGWRGMRWPDGGAWIVGIAPPVLFAILFGIAGSRSSKRNGRRR